MGRGALTYYFSDAASFKIFLIFRSNHELLISAAAHLDRS